MPRRYLTNKTYIIKLSNLFFRFFKVFFDLNNKKIVYKKFIKQMLKNYKPR